MPVDRSQKNTEVANQLHLAIVVAEICEREGIPYTRKMKRIIDHFKNKKS